MYTSDSIKNLISSEDIQRRIAELGQKLNDYYHNEEIYLVCVLKGAVMFAVDLAKHLKMPVRMEFIRLSSYGSGFTSADLNC